MNKNTSKINLMNFKNKKKIEDNFKIIDQIKNNKKDVMIL